MGQLLGPTLKLKIPKDPLDLGFDLFPKTTVEFGREVTVLVGCNGAGKTTLLRLLEEKFARDKNYVFCAYDNMSDGGHNAKDKHLMMGDMRSLASLTMSSEGEAIRQNIGDFVKFVGRRISETSSSRPIIITFDASDSGLSIDNMVDLKEFFQFLIKDAGRPVYIIVSTNSYEFARFERCLDVTTLNTVSFKEYEEYREFILESRKRREAKETNGRQSKKRGYVAKHGKDNLQFGNGQGDLGATEHPCS